MLNMEKYGVLRFALVLMLICLLAGLALSGSYRLTRPEIEKREREEQKRALEVVLPEAVSFSGPQKGRAIDFYRGFDENGRLVGYAFLGEAKGYSGEIKVMVGIDPKGTITAIEITGQKETPGLGDKIVRVPARRTLWQVLLGKEEGPVPSRPPFQAQFAGRRLDGLKVVNHPTESDIEAITGATISSRGVTEAVRGSLSTFLQQMENTEFKSSSQ